MLSFFPQIYSFTFTNGSLLNCVTPRTYAQQGVVLRGSSVLASQLGYDPYIMISDLPLCVHVYMCAWFIHAPVHACVYMYDIVHNIVDMSSRLKVLAI